VGATIELRITDNSNNAMSGAELMRERVFSGNGLGSTILIAYDTPATINATTYKSRFRVSSGTGKLLNSTNTGQMYAIEVSA
jgi:hypothetical protein